jgi:O-antigen ligase
MFPIIPLFWPIIALLLYGNDALLNIRGYAVSMAYNRPGIFSAYGAIIAYLIIRSRQTIATSSRGFNKRIIWVIVFVADIVVCVLTSSRKSLIVIIVGCMVYELLCSRHFLKGIGKIIIGLTFIAIIWDIILHIDFLYDLIGRNMEGLLNGVLGNGESIDSSTYGRMRRIERGFEWFLNRKFLGYGVENYSVLSGMYRTGFDGIADNNFIELLVDFGLVGFLFYYGFVIICLIKNIRKKNMSPFNVLSIILLIALLVSDYGSSNYKSALAFLIIAICSFYAEVTSNDYNFCDKKIKQL